MYLRVEPLQRGQRFEFVDKVAVGVIPKQLIPAVEKGVRLVMDEGFVAGFPLQDIRVSVYDGKHHSVDSKEVAFVAAGKKAFMDALSKARSVVIEPIVEIAITAPNHSMGDINADLSSKRGRINNTTAMSGGMSTITGLAPLSELDSYQSQLKSITGGTGSFSFTLSHYDPVPARMQKQLIASYKPVVED